MADKTGYIGRNPADSSVKVARQTFTPTTATTDFTFASGYTVGYLDLFLNGSYRSNICAMYIYIVAIEKK